MKRFDATVAGVVLIFALAYLDAAWEGTVIAATVVIGPFLTAIFASVRNTALVAGFAVLSAILSGGYNDNYGTTDYFVRLGATIAGRGASRSSPPARCAGSRPTRSGSRSCAARPSSPTPRAASPRWSTASASCWCPRSPTSA